MAGPHQPRWILALREATIDDVPRVGGKNAALGEMLGALAEAGIRIPDGFAITVEGYRHFLDENALQPELERILENLDTGDLDALARDARKIREAIREAPLPGALAEEIEEAYDALGEDGEDPDVAVRSSATAEDLPEASFAGQQETFLHVRGKPELLDTVRACFASLFTARAISYREERGFDHFSIGLSVGVQRMVRSDLACAGVLFTVDTETGFPGVVLVDSSWGLGEAVVQGRVDPDAFVVHKDALLRGYRPILERSIGGKQEKVVYSKRGRRHPTRTVKVPRVDRTRPTLRDDEVLQLARWGIAIEEHFSKRAGEDVPVDVEWAKDGRTGELFVLQSRPETVHATKSRATLETFRLEETEGARRLATGKAVGDRIGAGTARVIRDPAKLSAFDRGGVLVTGMTDPDWEPTMKLASAIVTDRGGRTCHAAIVSRELGIPCVVGAGDATEAIEDGTPVTVSCAEGERGVVYEGRLEFTRETVELEELPRTRTKLSVNIADPDRAFAAAMLPAAGVGLARQEFLVSSAIGIHPLALVKYESVPRAVRRKIDERTRGWSSKTDFFVEKLAEGLGRIAGAFWPRPVLARLSDFKSNEYRGLIGGAELEPEEANPMIGFRGASRYREERFRDAFLLECAAMEKVRSTMGLDNLHVMVPFCRTIGEAKEVLEILAGAGLERGKDGLEVWVMAEVPSNVILVEAFAGLFDGFSIGSNDLTQLVLGVDRDSELLADLFDERDEAVTRFIAELIRGAHQAGRPVSICGDAPSTFPRFARFLVEHEIDGMSLSPDRLLPTLRDVADFERRSGISAGEEAPAPS